MRVSNMTFAPKHDNYKKWEKTTFVCFKHDILASKHGRIQ